VYLLGFESHYLLLRHIICDLVPDSLVAPHSLLDSQIDILGLLVDILRLLRYLTMVWLPRLTIIPGLCDELHEWPAYLKR
jgi:hypothetical protein